MKNNKKLKLNDASREEIIKNYKKLKRYYFNKIYECQQRNLYAIDSYKYFKRLMEGKSNKNVKERINAYLKYQEKMLNTSPFDKVLFQGEVLGCPSCKKPMKRIYMKR